MTISPQLQDALAKAGFIILIILATLWGRRVASTYIRRAIHFFLRGVNFVSRRQYDFDEQITTALTPPVRLLILIIGLQVILLLVELPGILRDFERQIINTLFLWVIFWGMYRLVEVLATFLEKTKRILHLDETIARFGRQVTKALILIFAFVVIMHEWGYDLAGLVAGLGIGGLAVALAAQDALANLIGYFVIIADTPFKVGHLIIVDDIEGFVEDITFRSTRLRKRDRSLVIIPNQTIVNASIVNWSRLRKRQLKMSLGITYNSTEEQIVAVMADIRTMLDAHAQVADDAKLVEFVEFGESSLNILILCFVKTILWEELQKIQSDINLKLMGILKQNGLEVAFPTRTILLERDPSETSSIIS